MNRDNKTMLKEIWEHLNDANVEPYFFGLGFIQCKVSQEERYHFYHPSLVPLVNIEEEIHDHRYDFNSTIIKGKLINKLYHFSPSENGNYYKEEESCNPEIKINNPNIVLGNIAPISINKYEENDTYFISHEEFHTINTHECITHLKRSEYKKEFAHVIRPIRGIKTCPFSKKIEQEKCWEMIKEMLKQ